MNIIICDDRIDDRKNLSDLLSDYGEKKNYEVIQFTHVRFDISGSHSLCIHGKDFSVSEALRCPGDRVARRR